MTKPQAKMLERLARGPQPTYGKDTAKVQNNLVAKGLAKFINDGSECSMTDAGWAELHVIRAECHRKATP